MIILDDFRPVHTVLLSHLLSWTDRYGFIGETKGGGVCPAYEYFVITSQYSIRDLFSDPADYEALERRCQTIFMDKPFD